MNCVMKRSTPWVLALVLGAMFLPVCHAFAEETSKPAAPAPATLDAQIEFLEAALSEGLRTQDWKMLELACTGYKASGLKGTDLELSLTRAERDAALDALRAYTGLGVGHITPFGLAARSRLGDAAAHAKLHAWSFDEFPEVKPPDQQLYASQPAEADKQMKAFQLYQQKVTQQEFALLSLALLKEPGVLDRAVTLAGTRHNPAHAVYYMGANSMGDTLVLAALAADPDQGLKKFMGLIADEKAETSAQIRIFSALVQLKAYSNNAMIGESKFTVRNDVGATLPQDFMKQVVKPYVALLKRYNPDTTQVQGYDMTLNSLLAITYQFPKGTLDQEALEAMVALKDKVKDPQSFMKQQIDQVLKMQGYNPSTAQKPPPPPKDF